MPGPWIHAEVDVMSGFLGGRVPDFEPKDSWLDGEAVRAAERIASVRSRMEDDKLTAEVIRVLEGKGYRVHRPRSGRIQ